MIDVFRSMRPKQWTKNLLVYAALIFSNNLGDPGLFALATAGFVVFCLLSGAVYLVNDVWDVEHDRSHPKKKSRPIAAGRVSERAALAVAAGAAALGLGGAFAVSGEFAAVSVVYLGLQLVYSLILKHLVILDVMSIAAGFVLRAVAGAYAIAVDFSPWLLACTGLLALFLALGKRRHELLLLEDASIEHRPILEHYSPAFLDQMIAVVTSSTVIAYSLYTFFSATADRTPNLFLTVPFVLYGIFRYLYLVHQRGLGGSPEELLLGDRPLLLSVGVWLAFAVMLLYWSDFRIPGLEAVDSGR